MKINILQGIKDYNGNDIKNDNGDVVTLRDILSVSLNSNAIDPNGQQEIIPAEQKAKIYHLSVKLWEGNEIDLTVEDRAFIKDRAGKIHGPLAYGRVCEILEGEE